MSSASGLEPTEKAFTGSTHRTRAPEATLAAYRPLMPRLGITRLANVTGLDRVGIPVVVAVRPMSLGLATAQGKGVDLPAATASALMEAIETWHAERVEKWTRYAPVGEIEDALSVELLPCRPGRKPHNAGAIPWVLGEDLLNGSPVWVPLDTVSSDFTTEAVRRAVFSPSTNGLASGNHLIEAMVHALCELIERDAVSLFDRFEPAAAAACRIAEDSVRDPLCARTVQLLREADIDVEIFDCTSDITVPVFSVRIGDAHAADLGPFRGHGCHPDREVALLRALSEAAQSRLTYISGSRDDLFRGNYRDLERMAARRARVGSMPRGTRSFADVPTIVNRTFEADLADVLARVSAVGIRQVAAVDLSRPDVGVPVVKIVAPGLENNIHHDRGYRWGPRGGQW